MEKGIEKSLAEKALKKFFSEKEQEEIVRYLVEKKMRLLGRGVECFDITSPLRGTPLKLRGDEKEREKINLKIKQKIKNYVLGRGFGFDVIEKVFEDLEGG